MFALPPNIVDWGSKKPRNGPKRYENMRQNDEMCNKNRRKVKELGCIRDLYLEICNCKNEELESKDIDWKNAGMVSFIDRFIFACFSGFLR